MKKTPLLAFGLLVAFTAASAAAEKRTSVSADEFEDLHKRIKPQAGESLFWQVDWLLSLDDALQQGARQGKPILIWSGAGGAPHTVC